MYKNLLLTFILFLTSGLIFSQSFQTNKLRSKFESYHEHVLIEKLYVNTDRSFYVAGETMYFSIFAVNSLNHTPLDMSKVVYIEILNIEGEPVLQTKIAMKDGMGDGILYLPASLNTGNYLLRAYTSWMKNFAKDFFFTKTITIANTFTSPDPVTQFNNAPTPKMRLYPEGGNLVQDLQSWVGFKITRANGDGIRGNGYLLSGSDTITSFSTDNFGVGRFTLVPDSTAEYIIHLDAGDSIYELSKFPLIQPSGMVMKVTSVGNKFEVKVNSNADLSEYVYLIVHTQNSIKVAEGKKLNNSKAFFDVEKSELGDGISYFTLFDQNQLPVAERLVFKFPEEIVSPEISMEKSSYSTREQSQISLKIPNDGKVSVKITLVDSLEQGSERDILAHMFNISEIPGFGHKYGDYFEQHNSKYHDNAIDNFLLTHDWSGFNWKPILNGERMDYEFIPELEGPVISFHLDSSTSQNKRNIFLLSVPGDVAQLYASQSKVDGSLNFATSGVFGKRELVLQTFPENQSFTVQLLDPFLGKDESISINPLQLNKTLAPDLKKRSVYAQAQNIYLNNNNDHLHRDIQDKIPFYGNPGKTYYLDDYTRFPTMEEVMREFVAEVLVRKRGGDYNFRVLNSTFNTFFDQNPLVLFNGIPINEINDIIAYDPLKITSIDIVTGTFMLGHNVWVDGVVSYKSEEIPSSGIKLSSTQTSIEFEGLDNSRKFFSPSYIYDKGNLRIPDFRTLLLWEPQLTIERENEVIINFSTSDITGTYKVTIEGISYKGELIYNTRNFNVSEF